MSEQLALFESLPPEPEGLRYTADFVPPETEQKLIFGIRHLPSCPFSSGSSRGSGGSLRSVSDTTTPCGSYSGPNRSRHGWTRLSRKSKRSAAPQPRSGRSFALNTTPGSVSAGIATSPTSTEYSAFRWDPPANSGFAGPPARLGIVYARCRTPFALHDVRRLTACLGAQHSCRGGTTLFDHVSHDDWT